MCSQIEIVPGNEYGDWYLARCTVLIFQETSLIDGSTKGVLLETSKDIYRFCSVLFRRNISFTLNSLGSTRHNRKIFYQSFIPLIFEKKFKPKKSNELFDPKSQLKKIIYLQEIDDTPEFNRTCLIKSVNCGSSNKEIEAVKELLGLINALDCSKKENCNTLRYGKACIFSDADYDVF